MDVEDGEDGYDNMIDENDNINEEDGEDIYENVQQINHFDIIEIDLNNYTLPEIEEVYPLEEK